MESQSVTQPQHPGPFVREQFLKPQGLAITKAAELVGVGRPAFSNFINGRAGITPEMAHRLEIAFGAVAADLLRMQAAFDAAQVRAAAAVTARRYIVPALEIKANDIEDWAENNIQARSRLAVLLRTLVNSTAQLTKSDFPGNDDAERPGWDGESACDIGNPWVPTGQAGWEFSAQKDLKRKPDKDFDKSIKANPLLAQRQETTFVFVTPRRWPGKSEWAKKKAAEKQWKDVRAYDASDLEQWVAQSVPAQAWLASERGTPTTEVMSLDDAWNRWTGGLKRPLPEALFETAVTQSREQFLKWYAEEPDKPFAIASDSSDEALAFLSALLPGSDPTLALVRDKIVIFTAPGAVTRLVRGGTDFIAVVTTDELQQELAPAVRKLHSVIVVPRNAAGVEPHVVLQPLSGQAFHTALRAANYADDEISRLSKESGRSLTVLRRRLSDLPGVMNPPWAKDAADAKALIPLYLAGSWNSRNDHDTSAVVRMAGLADTERLEEQVAELAALKQAPVWRVGSHRGVCSKLDAMYATQAFVTSAMLDRFFQQARVILAEDDPKLDLPEDKRWAAAIYNKSRQYSDSLREGIAESLVLLAVHGNAWFGQRIGFDCAHAVDELVRHLMLPMDTRKLEAAGPDLRAFSEASPEVFLRALEDDMDSDKPATVGLLRPSDTMFGGCPRTDLLWALEGLAWNPTTLSRAALLLAKLARVPIQDSSSNKPMSSLVAIFRSCMPQTAATLEERLQVVHQVVKEEPEVAWKFVVALLDPRDQFAGDNHKPRWRNDGYGHGNPIDLYGPIWEFRRGVARLALAWQAPYSAGMLCDLIDSLASLAPDQMDAVWTLVQQWAADASDQDKSEVREKVRVSVLSKRVAKRAEQDAWPALTDKGRQAFALLEPGDVVYRNAWLFKESWLPDSADELFEDTNFEARDRRVLALRTAAVREVLEARGLGGLLALAAQGSAAEIIGFICSSTAMSKQQLEAFARECAVKADTDTSSKLLLAGIVRGLPEERHAEFLLSVRDGLTDSQFVEALLRAPFDSRTWGLVDRLSPELRAAYWKQVVPWHATENNVQEAVRRLTVAGRPRAAFHVAQFQLERLGAMAVYELLRQIAHESTGEPGEYKLQPHWVQNAFAFIEAESQLSLEQKALLEFVYIDALWSRARRQDKHFIPSLEEYIEQNPDFYVQALVWAFKRRDGQEDPPELQTGQNKTFLAQHAYKMLEAVNRLPAYNGKLKPEFKHLETWLKHVRDRARGLGRKEVADINIGRLLASEPAGVDGVWPGPIAREAIERLKSDKVAQGAHVARINSRGAFWRVKGGAEERRMAAEFRNWAAALRYSHPFVSSRLLEALAQSYENDARRVDEDEMLRELRE